MKKIKILLIFSLLFVLSFGIYNFYSPKNTQNVSSAAPSTITYNPLEYITITSNGQVLTSNNITTIDGVTSSVMINGSTTINLPVFNTRYSSINLQGNEEYFTKNVREIEVVRTPNKRNMSFYYNGMTIYCEKRITSTSPQTEYYYFADDLTSPTFSMSTNNTSQITYYETGETVTFYISDSYSLNVNAVDSSADFKFSIYTGVATSTELTVRFLKPILKFANGENPLVEFETYKDFDIIENNYLYYEIDTLLQSEQTFNRVTMTFLNDSYEYSKDNPLYFRINFNGFTYTFTFYSEEVNGENCLIVSYVDSVTNVTQQLATNYSNLIDDYDNPYIEFTEKVASNERFSMSFNYRGRYAIEFYDNTYLENLSNANYYSTSFYLKNDSASDEDTEAKFNDIYILAQTIDDSGNPIEYIVNRATLNNSVTVTLKNLTNFSETLELSDIIDRIEVTITEFGNSGGNHPVTTTYYPVTEENMFDTSIHHLADIFSINSEGDYYLTCSDDAIYRIEIFSKNPKYDEFNDPYYDSVAYQFTIVKKIKATFKPDVDDDSVDSTHTATIPYMTETINYTNRIQNSDPIQFSVKYGDRTPTNSNKVLDITYLNEYYIMYGMQTVDISSVTNEDNNAITFTFLGVGDMTVYITYNGVESVYTFNSEKLDNKITFSEYGTYSITLVDSMGTMPTEAYVVDFEKGLNTSALILIILSSIIVLAIVVFIIMVRSRVRTR